MSSTWEQPAEDAPTEAPAPSDAPTGDESDDRPVPPSPDGPGPSDPS
jgi:hypothetical protein